MAVRRLTTLHCYVNHQSTINQYLSSMSNLLTIHENHPFDHFGGVIFKLEVFSWLRSARKSAVVPLTVAAGSGFLVARSRVHHKPLHWTSSIRLFDGEKQHLVFCSDFATYPNWCLNGCLIVNRLSSLMTSWLTICYLSINHGYCIT